MLRHRLVVRLLRLRLTRREIPARLWRLLLIRREVPAWTQDRGRLQLLPPRREQEHTSP